MPIHWSVENLSYLIVMYPWRGAPEVAKDLGASCQSVRTMASVFGLRRIRSAKCLFGPYGSGPRPPRPGRKHTPESRAKISSAKTGKRQVAATARKRSESYRARLARDPSLREKRAKQMKIVRAAAKTPEALARNAKSRLGNKASAETRKRMSESQKARMRDPANREKLRAAALKLYQERGDEIRKKLSDLKRRQARERRQQSFHAQMSTLKEKILPLEMQGSQS